MKQNTAALLLEKSGGFHSAYALNINAAEITSIEQN